MSRILAVVAHPDDEVLGVGGTLAHHAAAGAELRDPPHPRGLKMLRARAMTWGQRCGAHYAEPFVLAREVW